ncbi:hypothetical protein JCGZ_10034 [Jatropha curcas]|uniref:MADS-box domain-containing protein n=1 Tax=Jatropha curcas TaxID=180498 RepID=A0A067LNZ3_JATCU|nr:agamous-like MADS-box protein AGL80 [Jatropha curcas]KDP46194.1 hypothetical protein JCGZ_10034 [Jatropha curcas]
MTRKKVKLVYMSNDSARRATFKKRKNGLIKKVSELTTLCGIDACAIIYNPYDSQPEVWPSPSGVQCVLAQLKNMPEMEQIKKMESQESFIRQRISKCNEQLKKQITENHKKEVTKLMFQGLTGKIVLNNLNMTDLNDLGCLIDQNLKEIYIKIETLKKQRNTDNKISQTVAPASSLLLPPQSGVARPSGGEVGRLQNNNFEVMNSNNMDAMQRQEWITDWIDPQEHMVFGDDEMMIPFGDNINQNSLWSNAFFP